MFNSTKSQCKKAYKFYEKELSNFETVMKDTNNNLVTADQFGYNCMSYALGVFDDWLCIDAFELSLVKGGHGEVDYELLENVFYECCVELKENFDLRRLSGPNANLAENERMIAFRIGADDFHFARKNSDGTWTHKPGRNYIREMSEEELLGDAWSEDRDYPYISKVAFFAVIVQWRINK